MSNSGSVTRSYWCHQCNKITSLSSDLLCNECMSGFVEEIETPSITDSQSTQQVPQSTTPSSSPSNSNSSPPLQASQFPQFFYSSNSPSDFSFTFTSSSPSSPSSSQNQPQTTTGDSPPNGVPLPMNHLLQQAVSYLNQMHSNQMAWNSNQNQTPSQSPSPPSTNTFQTNIQNNQNQRNQPQSPQRGPPFRQNVLTGNHLQSLFQQFLGQRLPFDPSLNNTDNISPILGNPFFQYQFHINTNDQNQNLENFFQNHFQQQQLYGDPGDYAFTSQAFQRILNSLVDSVNSNQGPPPASKKAVDSLKTVTICQSHIDLSEECSVCREKYYLGDEAKELPCKHLFHPSCIFPWLSSRNTCPVCRYELETENSD